jgi:flagellar assembly protein FliH
MDISSLPVDEVESLIAQMLSDKDPASVGLRRIIRKKNAERFDYPLRTPVAEDFDAPGKAKKLLTEDERRTIELERLNGKLKEEIKTLDAKARGALQKAFEQGLEEGRKKGREQGIAEATAKWEKTVKGLQDRTAAVLRKFEEEKSTVYANADRTVLALCLKIVRKIIAVEPVTRPEVILAVVKKALSYISDREKITIRLSSDDFKTVEGNRDFWAPVNEQLKSIAIEQDARIERGGCMVESASGMVDARIGVQLDEITELIEKALSNGPLSNSNIPEAENG